jgi:hypothetical protein
MTVRSRDDYTIERLTLERVLEVIPLAGKALGGGEDILSYFAKVRAAKKARGQGRSVGPTGAHR